MTDDATLRGRPYLSLFFECCRVYQRVYQDRAGTHYLGRCPRCLGSIRFAISPDGTARRAFRVK
ncbi:MAG: hypothetical protein OEV94_00635 [Deltaproteobacteria bacterium]|nr:hypothetical protein [Deltaproteobacteria bacterium]